jgi:hypothetical protein
MTFWKKLAELREANTSATENTNALLKQADKDHEAALDLRERVVRQAGTLARGDRRNHYSESLTKAFRGRTA